MTLWRMDMSLPPWRMELLTLPNLENEDVDPLPLETVQYIYTLANLPLKCDSRDVAQ